MSEQWLSIVEYARTFGISDMTIRRRIRTGRLQAVLRDGKYYIPTVSDPATGEPRKQNSGPKQTVPVHAVKSHPHAEKTMPSMRGTQSIAPREHHQAPRVHHAPAPVVKNWHQIPTKIAATIATEAEVSVEARALLDYCNDTLESARDKEKLLEGRFMSKIEVLAEQLKNREIEIQRLQQQIEDLQLLVQILERKKS